MEVLINLSIMMFVWMIPTTIRFMFMLVENADDASYGDLLVKEMSEFASEEYTKKFKKAYEKNSISKWQYAVLVHTYEEGKLKILKEREASLV